MGTCYGRFFFYAAFKKLVTQFGFFFEPRKQIKFTTMSFEAKFTEEEQVLLSTLPMMVGSAMVMAEGSGLGTVKEMISNSRSFLSGGKAYGGNAIIAGILPNMQDFSDAMDSSKKMREELSNQMRSHEIKSNEELRQLALDNAAQVASILSAKSEPGEAADYKNWVINIATEVANAAKEGGFLGFGGTRVSDGEQTFLDAIKKALVV